MGASMVKHCLGSDGMASPRDAAGYPAPRRAVPGAASNLSQPKHRHHLHHHHQPTLNQQRPPSLSQRNQLAQQTQHQQPPHRACHAVLDGYHAMLPRVPSASSASALTPPRKLSPYDRFRQELQRRSPALPFHSARRERYDSRESTCSSSSSTEEELLGMLARADHHLYHGHHHAHHRHHLHHPPVQAQDKDRRRRGSSRRSPARSYASTAASEDSFCRSVTPASSTNSSRRSRVSSPSFGFEDLLPECYVLEELIGSGTTSKCYRCRRTTDGKAFACKIINKRRLAFDHFQRDEMAAQLRQEVDVLRRLDHPNIAKLEESFENDTYILLMMELLEGGELFETIIDRVRFSEADAKHTARSILSAISYMHAKGIVHRDIKPENLLLAAQASPGKPLLVKIVDFGFASAIDSRATMTSFLGTGGYLAPEVLTHQPYTAAVDTWAFGVLLYLMLCGRLPFTTAIQLQPGQRLSSVYRLTFPDKYWRGVSSSARDLLTKLLVVNPSRRLTAAEALKHPWFRSD